MMIIGCDLHTRYQQIAMLDTESGELVERRLEHESGEARAFYGALGSKSGDRRDHSLNFLPRPIRFPIWEPTPKPLHFPLYPTPSFTIL